MILAECVFCVIEMLYSSSDVYTFDYLKSTYQGVTVEYRETVELCGDVEKYCAHRLR